MLGYLTTMRSATAAQGCRCAGHRCAEHIEDNREMVRSRKREIVESK